MQVSHWVFGLSLAVGLYGCGDSGSAQHREFKETDNVQNTAPAEEHFHGPNGGHVLELKGTGVEYHAEIAMDASRKISVYLIDESLKNAVPVDKGTMSIGLLVDGKETALEMTAAPKEGEADGKCSRFELAADKVPAALGDIEALAGTLTLKVGDQELKTSLTEDHGHDHGHDHGDHKH